jgi:hypothetical protein
MQRTIEIEDIEALRHRQGIDDAELREEIGRLQVGDHVRLTFLLTEQPFTAETLTVRVTSIHGPTWRGTLSTRPAHSSLACLRVGSRVVFTRDQIHSVAAARPKLSATDRGHARRRNREKS